MSDPTRTAAPPDSTQSLADDAPSGTGVAPAVERYVLGEEIARGGMGVVYRAADAVLGREVAVKVLLDQYAPDSGTARRFADEARITAQLQHPGIPPVHDLGGLSNGRPFLAMKLIKGQTLDALLKDRPNPAEDRGRFVAAFEQVCQALAYAHAHHVIHRDLKPANVMVGSFGEVQVMDWGLAKVLVNRGGDAAGDPDPDATVPGTVVQSLRDSGDLLTQAGSVLGTPAFMPPEQAVGAVGKVDTRSDVFGLGAILAVVLTGQPPFAASSTETTRVKAAQGDVAECFARLDGCGADPELVALAKRCLAPKPADRPADAEVVAKAVAALRAAADERARQAELDKLAVEVRAGERAKRRRVIRLAATVLMAIVTLGSAATAVFIWREKENTAAEWRRAERERVRAEGNFAVAWDLTTGLFGLVERTETGQDAGRPSDPERKVWLDRVTTAAERFLADAPDDPDQLIRVARLYRFAANLNRLLNDTAGAERAYKGAVRLQAGLVERFPDDPDHRVQLSHALRDQAAFLLRVGRLSAATEAIDRAIGVATELRTATPTRPESIRAEALARLDAAQTEIARERFTEAEATATAAAGLLDALLAGPPAGLHPLDPVFRGMAATQTAKARRGKAGPTAGPDALAPALQAHDEAVKRYLPLVENSRDRDVRHHYYRALAERARTALRVPARRQKAVNDLTAAIRGWTELAGEHPQTPMYREGLGTAHLLRGRLRAVADASGASADLAAALKVVEELVRSAPELPGYRALLGEVWVGRAELATTPDELDTCVDRAMSSYRAARTREPENPAHARSLADTESRWPEATARVAAKRETQKKGP
jgi:tetratricopeptide (TPR) repeat protein